MVKLLSKIPEGPIDQKWSSYKSSQNLVNPMGAAAQVVAVEDVHRVAICPQHGADVEKSHGDGADILLVNAIVEEIRIDQ